MTVQRDLAKRPWIVDPAMVLSECDEEKVRRTKREQIANLNKNLDYVWRIIGQIVQAGGVPDMDSHFVLWGSLDPDLPNARLHEALTEPWLHWPRAHAARHIGSLDPLPLMPMVFPFEGMAQAGRQLYGCPMLRLSTFQKVALNCPLPPTGASITADLMVDGVAQGKVATLNAGAVYQLTDITDLTVAAGSVLGAKILTVGSTFPGQHVVLYAIP